MEPGTGTVIPLAKLYVKQLIFYLIKEVSCHGYTDCRFKTILIIMTSKHFGQHNEVTHHVLWPLIIQWKHLIRIPIRIESLDKCCYTEFKIYTFSFSIPILVYVVHITGT